LVQRVAEHRSGAAAALGVTDLSDREAVKNGLAVTLVKSSDHARCRRTSTS
jgi:hypothetical protein